MFDSFLNLNRERKNLKTKKTKFFSLLLFVYLFVHTFIHSFIHLPAQWLVHFTVLSSIFRPFASPFARLHLPSIYPYVCQYISSPVWPSIRSSVGSSFCASLRSFLRSSICPSLVRWAVKIILQLPRFRVRTCDVWQTFSGATVIHNLLKSGCYQWATLLSAHSFARTGHSFACSALLASLTRSAALTRSLARSLTRSRARGTVEYFGPGSLCDGGESEDQEKEVAREENRSVDGWVYDL